MLGLVLALGAKASADFDAWYNRDKWDVVGDAVLSPQNYRRLVGRPGTGVLINGQELSHQPTTRSRRLEKSDDGDFARGGPFLLGVPKPALRSSFVGRLILMGVDEEAGVPASGRTG